MWIWAQKTGPAQEAQPMKQRRPVIAPRKKAGAARWVHRRMRPSHSNSPTCAKPNSRSNPPISSPPTSPPSLPAGRSLLRLRLRLRLRHSSSPASVPSMESSALRSFHYSVTTLSHARSLPERAGVVPVHCSWSAGSKFDIRRLKVAGNIFCSPKRRNAVVTSSVKASDAVAAANSSVPADSTTNDSKENNALQSATFPAGFEALLLEVCDETEVAELKLK
ncbi:hypothetical protein CRG98_047811, partial [Punica granatum]